MRFVKPLDEAALLQHGQGRLVVTLEENALMGGAGTAVSEFLQANHINTHILHIALPDQYEEHASHAAMLKRVGLDAASIQTAIETKLAAIKSTEGKLAVL